MRGSSERWTEEQKDLLKLLWAQGLSASAIAARLGEKFTRSSVLGKVHRLRLPLRTAPQRCNGSAIKNKIQAARLRAKVQPDLPPKPLPKLKGPEQGSHNVPFIKRMRTQCAMFLPDQQGAHGLVCGKPVLYSTNWCSECTQIVYDCGRKKEAA